MNINADLKRSYYDKSFGGRDMEASFQSARQEIAAAGTNQQRYDVIHRYLAQLDDSHTYFVAPRWVGLWDYGFSIRFYNDVPFVVTVDRATSADSAGLRRGDEIVLFAGKPLIRRTSERIVDAFMAQHPIPELELAVRAPDQSVSSLRMRADTAALLRLKGADFRRFLAHQRDSARLAEKHALTSILNRVLFWRLPQFEPSDDAINEAMERARKHETLILDLRGNPGGSMKTLTRLVEHFVDRQLMVGALQTRLGDDKYTAKPRKERFSGKLIILMDSESASASEIFARLMQLEGRATVIGDRSAGAVMVSQFFIYDVGALAWVAASITVSDFVLYNGERLEKVGVRPDIYLVPTARQIAAGDDPVLAKALELAGVKTSPATAARVAPVR